MDVGGGAIKPFGLSWQFFAGSARGGARAPGPGLQQRGGVPGPPVRWPQQPWGHYNPQLGLNTPQADASYGGGPRLGLQQPAGPGSRGPGLGMQLPGGAFCGGPGTRFPPPGGPYCGEPGPGLQPPGGPCSSEPGWWPQQPLGPGSRAPETKPHGGFYSGQAGMGPQLVGIPGSASGPGMGPQQPGGPFSQGMGMRMQTGAPYITELEPSHQRVSGSGGPDSLGLGLPQPGGTNNIDPGMGLQMPIVHQGRIYISSQNKNHGYKSGGPGQGWECPPMSVSHSRNQSLAGTSRSTGCSPAGMSRSHNRDRSPAGMSRRRDRSPAGTSGRRGRSPAGMSLRRGRSPAGTSRRRDRSPAGTSGRRDRSPAGTSRKRDRSSAGSSRRRDRSSSGESRRRDRSPTGTSRRRDTTGSPGLLIPFKLESKGTLLETKRTKLSLQRLRSLKVEPFPPHCSVKSIQEALQDVFGKFGEITSIQVNGKAESRSAMVFYKFVKDRDSALSGTQGTSLFNMNICVTVWPYKKIQSYTAEVESGFFAEVGSGTLYISNLSKSVSRNDLLRSFSSFGEIFYTEVQKLPGVYNYGVVQFTEEAGANKAISEMNGVFLSRSMLKEKFGDSFSSNCIFVYGLSKTSYTPSSLVNHFCQFGTLKKVLCHFVSGRALVFFEDLSSAEKAIHEIREKSAGNLLMGDYANHEFIARFSRSMRQDLILKFGKQSKSGTKYLAKENETQIFVDNSEEQQKDLLTGEEEAGMLAEASEEEEEEEADMLAEVSEKMEVLNEVGEEQEEVSPLLDWSEKIEASSDSGEEAAEPLPVADEISMPAFAEVVKKNTPSERNSTFLIPVIGRRKKSK